MILIVVQILIAKRFLAPLFLLAVLFHLFIDLDLIDLNVVLGYPPFSTSIDTYVVKIVLVAQTFSDIINQFLS